MNLKVISFDLDGTLVNYDFVDFIWFESIPSLYAKKQNITFEDAQEYVRREYDKVGIERLEWYNVQYWLDLFNLDEDAHSLLNMFKSRVKCYHDSLRVLKKLKKDFKLVIITNSPRAFLTLEIGETGIGKYIDRFFSSTSDF